VEKPDRQIMDVEQPVGYRPCRSLEFYGGLRSWTTFSHTRGFVGPRDYGHVSVGRAHHRRRRVEGPTAITDVQPSSALRAAAGREGSRQAITNELMERNITTHHDAVEIEQQGSRSIAF